MFYKAGLIHYKDGRKNCYAVRVCMIVDGKKKRKVIKAFSQLQKALDFIEDYNSKNKYKYKIVRGNDTFGALFKDWFESKHSKKLERESTRNGYIRAITKLYSHLFSKKISKIKINDLQKPLNEVTKTVGQSAKVILKWMYREALKREYCQKDITIYLESSDIKKYSVDRRIIPNSFVNELWKKYNETGYKDYAMILVLFYSGMRPIDLLRLENKNINFENNFFVTGSKTDAGRNRKIPIHKKLLDIFKKYYNKNNKLLFPELKSEDILRKRFLKINKEFDIEEPYTLYSIRHTFITKLLSQCNNDYLGNGLKSIVGHKIKDITYGVYKKYSVREKRDIIQFVDYNKSDEDDIY